MITGPNTVNDGLVFGYDADDRSTRFYPGEPTTNLLKKTTDFSTGWTRINVTTTLQTNVKNPFGLNENVYLWSTSNSTNHQLYYGGIGTTEQRVFSCYAKKTLHKGFYLHIYNDGYVVYFDLETKKITSTVGSGVQGYIDILDNDWCRCSIYAPKATVEIHIGFLDNAYSGTSSSPWAMSTAIGTEGLIFGPQFEFNTHPTAYLPNPTTSTISRTATQSLIDLKKNVTIDVSNLSFNWKGSPYFYAGATGKLLDLGSFPELDTGDVSIDFWAKDLNSMVIVGKHYNNFEIRGNSSRFSGYIGTTTGWYDFGVNANISHGISANDVKSKYNHFCYVLSFLEKKMYFYANGQLKGTHPYSNMYHYTTGTNLYIGQRHDGTGKFSGNIPIIKIYNKSLTESEVLQNYNASKGRFELENRLSDGLVLHLDAGNKNSLVSGSTTWYDLAGSNNGTLTNGPSFSSVPESLVFDGVDDYISCGTNSSLNMNNSSFTLVNFIYPTGTNDRQIMSKGDWSVGNYQYRINTNNKLTWWLYGHTPNTISSDQTIPNNTWSFVAMVYYPNNKVQLFFNGNLIKETSISGIIGSNTQDFQVGSKSQVEFFNGKISKCLVYNRALSSTEISQFFEMERGRYGI